MDNNMNNMGQPVMQQPVNNGTGMDVNKVINDLTKDKKSLIALAGAILTIIACFVNFVSVKMTIFGTSKSESWNLMNIAKGKDAYFSGSDYAGIILILLAIATIVFVVLKKHVYTAASAGLSLITLIIEVFRIKNTYNKEIIEKLGKSYSKYIKLQFNAGLIIAIVGIALVGVSLYFLWKENPNCFKDAINQLKAKFGGNKGQVQAQPMQQPVAPVAPVQPVQPQAPVAPVQPTYEAPMNTEVPTETVNNDINNNVM